MGCKFFLQGSCLKVECPFLHQDIQLYLRPPNDEWRPLSSKKFRRNTGDRDDRDDRDRDHDNREAREVRDEKSDQVSETFHKTKSTKYFSEDDDPYELEDQSEDFASLL